MGTDPIQDRSGGSTRRKGRAVLWILALIALVTLGVSGVALAQRISAFNADRDAPMYAYIQVAKTEFDFYDHHASISEATIDGRDYIRIDYADEELLLPVEVPPTQPLPTLYERHKDWFTVLLFADRADMSMPEFVEGVETGRVEARIVVATRAPFGAEPPKEKKFDSIEHEKDRMWGESRRDLWLFSFYEFKPDGTITIHQPLRFPESGASLLRRQNYAKLRGEEIPQREPGELREYTWQYGAALKLSPRPPAITMENQALRNAGWTLPVAAASVLMLFVCVFFAIAPARTSDPAPNA
jgi:hypothetical protein